MPYHITKEPDLLRVVFFDNLTPQDLLSLADAIAAIEQAQPVALNRLADLTQVSGPELTYAAMLAFVERRKAQRLANPVKSAIVAPTPVHVGFARMFQILNDHPQIEVEVFATVEAAEAWLAV
jgi:hypothetical protein